jgi:hypothetical protein
MPTSSIARPSKIFPNWYFWFENISSGNPGVTEALKTISLNAKSSEKEEFSPQE